MARHGCGRVSARCHSVSGRTRRHQQREPAGDARSHQADPCGARRLRSGQGAPGRGQSMAGRCQRLFRRRRRMPHGLSLPAHAPHLHGDRAGGPISHNRHPAADAGYSIQLSVGSVPAQSRRAHARNGDRRRARLSLVDLCHRPARAAQPGHSATARSPDGQ